MYLSLELEVSVSVSWNHKLSFIMDINQIPSHTLVRQLLSSTNSTNHSLLISMYFTISLDRWSDAGEKRRKNLAYLGWIQISNVKVD